MTSNSELQNKWKTTIQMTCLEYRVKIAKELWSKLVEAMRKVVEKIKNAFKGLIEDLSEFRESIQDYTGRKCKSYPHSFPHYVDKLPINTKGFPQPIMRCARSRC